MIAGSAQIGIASGFLGAIGVFAKGAPVRIIGGSYTGGAQVFWFVRADSPVKTPQDLAGKTIGYSTNGSSTHAGILALQKHYKVNFKPVADRQRGCHDDGRDERAGRRRLGRCAIRRRRARGGQDPLIMKSGDAPDFDKQTNRVIIANANELKARPDVIHALHARLSRVAEMGLFNAGGSQGLCRLCRPVGRHGANARWRNSCRSAPPIPTASPGSTR